MSQMNICSTKDFYDIILLFLYVAYFSLVNENQSFVKGNSSLHGNKNEEIFLFMLRSTFRVMTVHSGRKRGKKTVSGVMETQIRS